MTAPIDHYAPQTGRRIRENGSLINVGDLANRFDGAIQDTDTGERVKVDMTNSASGFGDLIVDAWGVQKMSVPHSLFHGMWTFDIPPAMWFMYEDGVQVYTSTNIVSDDGSALIDSTGLTSARLESRQTPRYQPNRGHLFSTALPLPNKTAAGTRDFGLFTAENGVYFRLKADGLLYAVLKKGGIEVIEELIDVSGLTNFDVEKNNIYDIQFQWRGAGNYKFFIGDPATGTSKLVHRFNLLGTLTSVSMNDPAAPIAFAITNAGGNPVMRIGCADVTSENGDIGVYQYESTFIEGRTVNGTDAPVIVILNPLQINSKTNTRDLQLARITFTCSKKATFKVWTGRDPSAFTGGTLQTLNAGSFVQTDSPSKIPTAVSVTAINTSLLRNVTSVPVESLVAREVINPLRERITFPLVRGDYLAVTCTASTATADCVIEWGESI
jgi:hypothetical protein